jgi:hypothetical protein
MQWPTAGGLKLSSFQRTAFVVAVMVGAGTWYYLFGVFLPYQRSHQPQGISQANRFDLYPRWLGTRELLLHGRNPYSPEVTREIQFGYYGKAVEPGVFSADEQRFAYPLYVVFFLAPTIGFSFSALNAAFGILVLSLTIASVHLWIRTLNLKFSRITKFLCTLVVLASWPVAEGLYVRQLSLVVAFLLACAGAEIAGDRLRVAGLCLACSMIKPQLAALPAAWLLLWALTGWKQRQSLVWSFVTVSGVLLIGAEFALPHWIRYWSSSLPAYIAYTGSKPSLERLFGRFPGLSLNLLLLVVIAGICWKTRKMPAQSESFGFAFGLILSTTLVILPTWSLASYNEVLLIPAGLWLCAAWKKKAALTGTETLILIFAAAIIAWEPLTTCAIALASRLPGFKTTEDTLRIPLYLYFLVPIVMVGALTVVKPRTDPGTSDKREVSS